MADGRRLVAGQSLPPQTAQDAQVVVSELLTNAVVHSGLGPADSIALRLSRHGSRLRIDVDDRDGFTGSSESPPPRAKRRRGHGLTIIDRLTLRWQAIDGCVSAWLEVTA
ncbi:MAG: ATP-binding protein [Solirubrobacteraceae bacterium]